VDGRAVSVDTLGAFPIGALRLPEVAVGGWAGTVSLPVAVKDAGGSMFACGGAMRRDFDGEQKGSLRMKAKMSASVDAEGTGCAIPPLTPLPDAVTTMRCCGEERTSLTH
jgi:hypothetical protein